MCVSPAVVCARLKVWHKCQPFTNGAGSGEPALQGFLTRITPLVSPTGETESFGVSRNPFANNELGNTLRELAHMNKHHGSNFEDYLKEKKIFDEVSASARKRWEELQTEQLDETRTSEDSLGHIDRFSRWMRHVLKASPFS